MSPLPFFFDHMLSHTYFRRLGGGGDCVVDESGMSVPQLTVVASLSTTLPVRQVMGNASPVARPTAHPAVHSLGNYPRIQAE